VTPTKDAPPRDGAEHDAALMARAKRGDVGAFAAVYDRHAPGVLSLLSRVLRDASEAHDLLHDVFLEAWLSASDYDERRASVRVWLLGPSTVAPAKDASSSSTTRSHNRKRRPHKTGPRPRLNERSPCRRPWPRWTKACDKPWSCVTSTALP